MACDDLESALIEISENMVRNELHPIELGESASRWVDILTEMGLKAKRGDNRYSNRCAESAHLKTTDDIAAKIGISKRVLQENVQLATNLIPSAKKAVREGDVSKLLALRLARLTKEHQQAVVDQGTITIETLKPFLQTSKEVPSTEKDADTSAKPEKESKSSHEQSKPSEAGSDDYANVIKELRSAAASADSVPALFEKATQLADVKYKKEQLKELLNTTYSSFTSIAEQLQKQFGAELKAKSKETTQKDKK